MSLNADPNPYNRWMCVAPGDRQVHSLKTLLGFIAGSCKV